MIKSLNLPNSLSETESIELPVYSSVVITGANGAGKTRLGAWLEFNGKQREIVRRISAQKSLSMPDYSQTSAIEEAECDLKFGYADVKQVKSNPTHWKTYQRWGQRPCTFLLDDYDKLMVYLFTELFQSTLAHSEGKTDKNNSILHKIKKIWESVLPHRELIIEAGRIKTKLKNKDSYNGSDMSDGERVVFYLIGQVLTASKDFILVIDEPELHLHKSIHAKLWDTLEKERSDCLFVFITHDLDFAAQKSEATRLWIKSYDGKVWGWDQLPEFLDLPEDLVLEVLGARVPVVFVEGLANSFDLKLYSLYYSGHLVIPKGSCENVIKIVKGLRESGIVVDKSIHGIIDRDRRVDMEIENLSKHNISVLSVAEVENLFITPDLIEIACEALELNYQDIQEKITNRVIETLQEELDVQVSKRVSSEIRHKLSSFNDKCNGAEKIEHSFNQISSSIDVKSMYASAAKEFEEAIAGKRYIDVLKLFNRKSLLTIAGEIMGMKKGEYASLIIRLSGGKKSAEVRAALSKYLPTISA